MAEIVVIGAGPGGLIAALRAAEIGHEVILLEASETLGGMAASFQVAGQSVDFGSHRLHPSTSPILFERLQGLLGDDLQLRERNGRIRLGNRWVAFPLRFGNMVRNLSPLFTSRVCLDMTTRIFRNVGEKSFHERLVSRLGPTITGEFYEPYSFKLYGVRSVDLAPELARRRISADSPTKILRKVFAARHLSGRTFFYPRLGYGQIVDRLAEEAISKGVDIQLDMKVAKIESAENSVGITTSKHHFSARTVLSSIPLPVLASCLQPKPPIEVTEALSKVRTRAMVLVYLVVPRPIYTPFDAHYFPNDEMFVSRLSEPKNYRTGPDPHDQTVLCAEIPCWKGDRIWEMGADDLQQLVVSELIETGLKDPHPVATEIRRLPSVYPVYELSTDIDRELLSQWAFSLNSIAVFGRQGLNVPDNLHHVLAMGLDVANSLREDGSLNLDSWQLALNRFKDHVVED
tara:strand:- start:433 stop:1809 length:1377 start_codon:yes stop_codon:yes gene_type:complete